MIYYILQIIAFQSIFLLVYDLFLKRETFFGANRFYLLFAPILGLLLPFVQIEALRQQIPQEFVVQLPAVIVGNTTLETGSTGVITATKTTNFLGYVWLLGSVFSAVYFLLKLRKLFRLKRQSTVSKVKGFHYYQLPKTDSAFTFCNAIFLGENLSEKQKENILLHEQVHVQERHTVDLLWFEMLKIAFWFNPLIYLFQNRIKSLHEFTADRKVAETQGEKNYYRSLLEHIFHTENFAFTNTFFNQSLIKKRISMLQKSKSSKTLQLKFLIVLPLIMGMLIISSCNQENETDGNEENLQTTLETKSSKNENEDESMPFALLDKAPIYQGCEGLESEETKKCFTQKIAQFVIDNFDTKVGSEANVVGEQRIVVKFVIDKEGRVDNVEATAATQALQDEAVRVIKRLPTMKPGENNGKKVAVQYALPILFEF